MRTRVRRVEASRLRAAMLRRLSERAVAVAGERADRDEEFIEPAEAARASRPMSPIYDP